MPVFSSIGAAIFGAGTFLAGLTAAGLQVAAGLVFSQLGKAMEGEPEPAKFGVQGRLQAGEDVPRSINLGWNCTAGSLAWHGTFGAGGTMSARVIALGDMPIRELLYPIVEGVDSPLLKSEAHPQYGWPVAPYRIGGVDHLWIKFYDGTQTAADPFLVATFGNDPDRPYKATRVGYGIPYVIIFARAPEREDGEEKPLFQGIPDHKFVTNGVRWYNPALDSTVGGSGAHRWNNPATWGGVGDFNPIVQLFNVLRGIRYGGQWLYGLQNTSAARLPAASWIAGILAAQAAIAGPSGMEPTFRAGGEVQVGAQVSTVVDALLTAANARLVESGGAYKIFVGPPTTPVMAFTDGDILSTEEQSFSPFLSLADTVNGVDATYPNPAEGWNAKKAPPLLRPDLEPLAGNRRLLASVSLDLVPYAGQAQRLMQWALLEALRARRHTFVLGPEFRVLEAGDVVRWTSARNGYVDKLFRVDGLIYKSNLDVIVDLTEVDPSDYDWDQATDYRPVFDGPLQLVGPKPMPMQGWQVFPADIVDELGRARRPSVEVRYASSLPSVERVRVQVRVGDESGPLIFDSDAHPYGDPWRNILQGQFPPLTPVVVRGIFIGPVLSEWSGWFAVTTNDVKLIAGLDFDPFSGVVGFEQLGDDLAGYLARMGVNMRDFYEQQQALALLAGDQDLANAATFSELRREVSVTVGSLAASFVETITVQVVPINGRLTAIADALTELSAGDGSDVSTARWRMTAVDGPTGYASLQGEARVDGADGFRSAAFGVDVPVTVGAPGRFWVDADQFVVRVGEDRTSLLVVDSGGLRVANALIKTASIGDAQITSAKIVDANITSAKIADAAITAAKIGTAQITTAKIADAQITSAKIGTAAVDTIKIAAGGVTTTYNAISVSAAEVPTPLAGPNNGTVDIVSLSVPVTEGGVLLMAFATVRVTGPSGGNGSATLELLRNGALLKSVGAGQSPTGGGSTSTVSMFHQDDSPSTSNTYLFRLRGVGVEDGTLAQAGATLIAMNNKR